MLTLLRNSTLNNRYAKCKINLKYEMISEMSYIFNHHQLCAVASSAHSEADFYLSSA